MILRRCGIFLIIFAGVTSVARADLTLAPRYEYIGGQSVGIDQKAGEVANRLIFASKLNANLGPFGLYVEGFGDFESPDETLQARRSQSQGYLQEAYIEFKQDSFYLRVGRQALRWSESWSLPSLDIWTGRRFNRLYLDPFSEQLTHSTGASASYAGNKWGLDVVVINELAKTTYPEPFPQTLEPPDSNESQKASFGGRLKWDLGGFSFSVIGASVQEKDYYGATMNYAFDSFVPKFEIGGSHDNNILDATLSDKQAGYFSTLGCDIFLGNFVLLPQVTVFDLGPPGEPTNNYGASYYFSLQWNPNRHNLQAQVYYDNTNKDSFVNLSYGYNLTDSFTMTGFVQNYNGIDNGLYNTFKDITGGWVAGVRLELAGNIPF